MESSGHFSSSVRPYLRGLSGFEHFRPNSFLTDWNQCLKWFSFNLLDDAFDYGLPRDPFHLAEKGKKQASLCGTSLSSQRG